MHLHLHLRDRLIAAAARRRGHLAGKQNARVIGGDLFKVEAVGADGGGKAATGKVTDHMNGTYTVKWTPTAAGVNRIRVTLDGDHISGCVVSLWW